ncbi:MAG: Peptidase M14 carboxypeptidase A [Parcubacteria group bacterium GW2011_GWA2_43_11]|nr:MAG: Peptidase M14 carboxypeptidase A [Parcubacteria group bacterium GW2011_GWC2_42_11]KKS85535.1 MAG: Peptidase M14 carboxypeptidase A [Parcubacteria group bacterium GW2011_GWA2_43_11]
MPRLSPKFIVLLLTPILVLGILAFIFIDAPPEERPVPMTNEEPVQKPKDAGEPLKQVTIGNSVSGRPIEAYTFGNGDTHLLFVGGIHGGYEWNSILLAYALIDQLTATPSLIPLNLQVSVIPSANPDGLFAVLGTGGRFTLDEARTVTDTEGKGRFNSNKVDLNRNFDCKWQPTSTWRDKPVSAGASAFSEPEAQAIRDFVLQKKPQAVVFFHSQSNAVYASECQNGILPITRNIMNAYSQASGYKAVDSFDAYEITGDAEGWLASINIPAITVELSTHETIEWDKNLAGIKALFEYFNTK